MQSLLKIKLYFLLVFFFFGASLTSLFGQNETIEKEDKSYLYLIKKKNGGRHSTNEVLELIGKPAKETRDSLWIYLSNETRGYKKSEVKSIEVVDYSGRFEKPDRNVMRHMFLPTARNLKKGKAYYQNVLIGGQTLSYGLTDNFSIAGGFEGITFAFEQELTWFLHPKFSTEVQENLNLGFGIMLSGMHYWVFEEIDRLVAVPYMNLSFGSSDYNVTIGVGRGFDWDFRFSTIPAGMIGTKLRISNALTFSSENALFNVKTENRDPELIYVGIHGIQWNVRRATFDLGFIYFNELQESFSGAIPYLGFAFHF